MPEPPSNRVLVEFGLYARDCSNETFKTSLTLLDQIGERLAQAYPRAAYEFISDGTALAAERKRLLERYGYTRRGKGTALDEWARSVKPTDYQSAYAYSSSEWESKKLDDETEDALKQELLQPDMEDDFYARFIQALASD